MRAALLAALLVACDGEPFTGALSSAAGGAGAPVGAAGDAGDGGESEDGAAAPGGRAGSSSAGQGGAGSSSGGVPACLPGWQGSPCDTCTSSPPPPSGETCAQVLACYVEQGGPNNCDFVKPTTDAVVKLAHDVLACRCK